MNIKSLQIQLRRFYLSDSPCKFLSKFIGIDKEQFYEYIQKYLQPDMSFTNFGELWQFDHIVPVCLFDLNNDEDLSVCFNYMNIIPMYNRDNKLKGASPHTSLYILNKRKEVYKENETLDLLIDKCIQDIENHWFKYK